MDKRTKFLRQMERIKNYMSFYCAGGDIFDEDNCFRRVSPDDYEARKYAIDIMITFINEDLGGGLSKYLKMLVYDAKCFRNGGAILCVVLYDDDDKDSASYKVASTDICSIEEFYDNIPDILSSKLIPHSYDCDSFDRATIE